MPEQSAQQILNANTSIGTVKGKKVFMHVWVGTPLLTLPFNTPSNIGSSGLRTASIQGEGGPIPTFEPVIFSLIPSRLRTTFSIASLIVQLPALNINGVFTGTEPLAVTYGYEIALNINNIPYGNEIFSKSFGIPASAVEVGYPNEIKQSYQSLQFIQSTPIPPNASIDVEVNAFREITNPANISAENQVRSCTVFSPLGSQLGVTMTYTQNTSSRR
jgi:hypothetical protein